MMYRAVENLPPATLKACSPSAHRLSGSRRARRRTLSKVLSYLMDLECRLTRVVLGLGWPSNSNDCGASNTAIPRLQLHHRQLHP
jgi:hypothetical protein